MTSPTAPPLDTGKTIEVDKRMRILEEQIGVRYAVAEIRGGWEPETTVHDLELRRLADRLPRDLDRERDPLDRISGQEVLRPSGARAASA